MKIAPSILSADFSRLGQEVREVESAGADAHHVDVMDGRFVPNITIGPLVVKALAQVVKLPLEVHLMIVEPERHVEAFVKAGADLVYVHEEVCVHLHGLLSRIRELGCRPAVSINPSTPAPALSEVLHLVDRVLVMTVNPGFGGQSFIPEAVPKIAWLAQEAEKRELSFEIEVDGGVGPATVAQVAAAGAHQVVAGSAVYGAKDRARAIRAIRAACEAVS
ncbi:MAG: ribulose-phosphate 3-epimerase [Deltaproteobacteria bacterium]|nr:ribulose-phosphate 3-epimerase [Deltaproteobacteria bacterium]